MGAVKYYLMALTAVSLYASLAPIAKKIGFVVPKFAFISISMLFLTLFATVASLLFERDFKLQSIDGPTLAGLLLFSAMNFTAFTLYIYVIQFVPVTAYQLVGMLTPLIGGAIAYFLLRESWNWQYTIGFVMMASGLFVALHKWR